MELSRLAGLEDGRNVERFDTYRGTSAEAKLSPKLGVRGVSFLARRPAGA